jgi:hypothetical protein
MQQVGDNSNLSFWFIPYLQGDKPKIQVSSSKKNQMHLSEE